MPKFKRYKNKYTNSPRIYSMEDFLNMSVGNMTRREKELTSQYKQIGLPTTSELKNSSNVVYVNEYTRGDGTVVHAHWRSKPENSGITETAMPSNYEIDTEEHWPENWPTKAPDRPIEEGGDNDNPLGEIFGGIGSIVDILLELFPLFLQTLSSDNGQELPMNLIVNNDSIPSVNLSNVNFKNSLKMKTHESIDPKTFVQDFVDKIVSSTSPSKPVQITAQGTPIKIDNVSNLSFGNTSADKAQPLPENKGISFEQNKKTNLQRINQPMAQHLSADMEKYINDLLKTSEKENKAQLKEKFINFVKDFAKGGVQGVSSIGTGLGKRYVNTIRQTMGKHPLSDDELDNIYAKVVGKKSDSKAYKTGDILGEIVPFLVMPEVRVASFPVITNLLLTNLYQSAIDSATHSIIENGISPKIVTDVIKGVALSIMNTITTHGLFKGIDKSNLLNKLQVRLRKLLDDLAESYPQLISQKDGTIVLKKAGSNGSEGVAKSYNVENYWKEKQVEIIKTSHVANGIKSVNDLKSFDSFDSVMNFANSKDYKYIDYKLAKQSGVIKAYTNDANFAKGCFVSPSMEEAYKFSKEGDIYFLYIPIEDIAWVDPFKGQYAPIKHIKDNMFEKPLTYTGKFVRYKNEAFPELNFIDPEYADLHSAFMRYIADDKTGSILLKKPYWDFIFTAKIENNLPRFIKIKKK